MNWEQKLCCSALKKKKSRGHDFGNDQANSTPVGLFKPFKEKEEVPEDNYKCSPVFASGMPLTAAFT